MKRITKERQRTIEAKDGATFDRLFEEAMEELEGETIEVVRNMSTGAHCAYICWKEQKQIPEDLRDEYILRTGEERHCSDCPELERNPDGRKKDHSCPMHGSVRETDRACLRYYRKLEEV